jgi:hypothetical protein
MNVPPAAVSAAVTDIVFTSMALLAVLLRVYTRVFVVKNFGVDDYLMVGSMVRRDYLPLPDLTTGGRFFHNRHADLVCSTQLAARVDCFPDGRLSS